MSISSSPVRRRLRHSIISLLFTHVYRGRGQRRVHFDLLQLLLTDFFEIQDTVLIRIVVEEIYFTKGVLGVVRRRHYTAVLQLFIYLWKGCCGRGVGFDPIQFNSSCG